MTTPNPLTDPAMLDVAVRGLRKHLDALSLIDDPGRRVGGAALVQAELALLMEQAAAITRDTVVHLREVDGLTFGAIGQRLGFSQQRASQIYGPKRAR